MIPAFILSVFTALITLVTSLVMALGVIGAVALFLFGVVELINIILRRLKIISLFARWVWWKRGQAPHPQIATLVRIISELRLELSRLTENAEDYVETVKRMESCQADDSNIGSIHAFSRHVVKASIENAKRLLGELDEAERTTSTKEK